MQLKLEQITTDELNRIDQEIKGELIKRFVVEEYNPILESKHTNSDGKFMCTHCKKPNTHKVGKTSLGKQRYKCKSCHKVMIASRDSLLFSSKKNFSQWVLYLESLFSGDSLDVSAEKAGISRRTAFRWRHKILYILNKHLNKDVLSGVITIDETLFPNIQKKKNGLVSLENKKRGMSSQKINVTCAIDSNGNTIIKVIDTGRVTAQSLIDVYDQMICEGSIVVTDSLRSYHQLIAHLNVEWKKIPSKKKSLGHYTLEPINSLHAMLKDFIYKYKGISVKYLQGYLAFFNYHRQNKKYYRKEQFHSMIIDIFTSSGHIKCSTLDSNCAIYH